MHTYLRAMPLFGLSKSPLSTLLSCQISPLIPSLNSDSLMELTTLLLSISLSLPLSLCLSFLFLHLSLFLLMLSPSPSVVILAILRA